MEKLYEILISYSNNHEVDLIKLSKEEIDPQIHKIKTSGRHGKLYVIEIDTLIGTGLVNKAEEVICYYDQNELADIVVKNNKLNLQPQPHTTFYIEKTINELVF